MHIFTVYETKMGKNMAMAGNGGDMQSVCISTDPKNILNISTNITAFPLYETLDLESCNWNWCPTKRLLQMNTERGSVYRGGEERELSFLSASLYNTLLVLDTLLVLSARAHFSSAQVPVLTAHLCSAPCTLNSFAMLILCCCKLKTLQTHLLNLLIQTVSWRTLLLVQMTLHNIPIFFSQTILITHVFKLNEQMNLKQIDWTFSYLGCVCLLSRPTRPRSVWRFTDISSLCLISTSLPRWGAS